MIVRSIAAGLLLCLAGFNAAAQQSLADLVNEAKADWMFGNWEAQTDSGETVTLNITWELDKHAIAFHVKAGDMEAKSFTVKDPSGEKVKYFSVDNRGTVAKGEWAMEGDELVLRTDSEVPDRGTMKSAVVFSGSASEGLKVRMHRVDASGDLADPPRLSLKMKKKA